MRAADLGYAPRFQAFSVASNWFRQNGVISSHPKRLTRAVGRADIKLEIPKEINGSYSKLTRTLNKKFLVLNE
jgi:hypothetical protein